MKNKYTTGVLRLLTLSVVLIGMNMRAPVTTVPLMLNEIASSLSVKPGQLGILTTIPLIMFVLISNFASKTMAIFGLKRAITFAVALILLGSLLRLGVNMPMVLIGTAFIGIGVAHLNVFMPSFVTAFFPNKIGLYTSLYTMSTMLGTAIFNLLTAPIMIAFGWHAVMWILVLLPALALIIWMIAARFAQPVVADKPIKTKVAHEALHVWNNKKAWLFLGVFGLQATVNYTFVAWMPSLMAFHKISAGNIGIAMALYSLLGMIVSLMVPNLIVRLSKHGLSIAVLIVGAMGLVSALMLFNQNTGSVLFWLIVASIIGIMTSFFFLIAMTMFASKTKTPYQTATVSGMAQSGGYLISAIGPMIYGNAFQQNPIGLGQNIAYTILIILLVLVALAAVQTDYIFDEAA